MAYGRQPQIDKDIDWVIDEDNNVLGYMKNPRERTSIVTAETDPVTGGIRLSAGGEVATASKLGFDTPVDPGAWPMVIPRVLQSPPAFAVGVANAASAIASSIIHQAFDSAKFSIFGGPAKRGVNYPNYLGVDLGAYPQVTSSSPTAIEFNLDTVDATGRFEISVKGSGGAYRVLVKQPDGSWGALTQYATRTTPSDGNVYLDLVTLGAAGIYTIRIEFFGVLFFGIRTAPTDTVSAVRAKKRRYIVVGDSFTEPTINDSGSSFAHFGWVQQLAHLTGYDIWSAGSGGTGYTQTNGARPKFSDRLANDILAFKPDGVIFAGGINDGAADLAALSAEVDKCVTMCKGLEVIVLSPFWARGIDGFSNAIVGIRNTIKGRAEALGVRFLDLLNYGGVPSFLSAEKDFATTLAAQYNSGTSISVNDIPAYFKQANVGLDGWFVMIQTANGPYPRKVTNVAGTGPYTLSISSALPMYAPAGLAVTLCGQSYQTGTGRQGATVGDGNSDRYTGPDTAHPTVAGHQNIARCVADMWSRSLAGR